MSVTPSTVYANPDAPCFIPTAGGGGTSGPLFARSFNAMSDSGVTHAAFSAPDNTETVIQADAAIVFKQLYAPTGQTRLTLTAAGTNNDVLNLGGQILQTNPGIITGIILTTPITLGPPFAPGGVATAMNLALEPVGASPHAQVALRLNFYDAGGNLIGTQDIV